MACDGDALNKYQFELPQYTLSYPMVPTRILLLFS